MDRFGSMDKTFGFFFGIFKGYVVSVCLFALLNWFYPLDKWGIEVDKSFTYSFLKNGSDVLIDEFPEYQEFENTKDKIEKSSLDKLREECGIFEYLIMMKLLSLLPWASMLCNIEDKRDVE